MSLRFLKPFFCLAEKIMLHKFRILDQHGLIAYMIMS
uniref:Uncharacterized protein n=1 Tax=Manihot esculenta TaxID=3983 RepID=A0A2C9USL2_MANES